MIRNPQTRSAMIERLHAQGLNDVEIAARLGVSARTVANHRRDTGLPPNARNMQTGLYGEQLVIAQAQALGLPAAHVAQQYRDHPFDVLLNSWRVEVKTVQDTSDAGVFKFFLSPNRKGRFANPRQVKNYSRDCDFFALVCKSRHGAEPEVFLMTPAEAGEYVRINTRDMQRHLPYRNAWHRLEHPKSQAAA